MPGVPALPDVVLAFLDLSFVLILASSFFYLFKLCLIWSFGILRGELSFVHVVDLVFMFVCIFVYICY